MELNFCCRVIGVAQFCRCGVVSCVQCAVVSRDGVSCTVACCSGVVSRSVMAFTVTYCHSSCSCGCSCSGVWCRVVSLRVASCGVVSVVSVRILAHAHFSTFRSHKSVSTHNPWRLFYPFAHLHLFPLTLSLL